MTIDEAIKHCEEVMVENMEKTKGRNASDPIAIYCFECAEEYRQLAEWLKDYKRLLEQEPKTEKVIKMRDATPEEQEAFYKYIKSISKSTGVDFLDLADCEYITPQPKTGRWIRRNSFLVPYKCSECNYESERYDNYCPNCGAKMD